MQLGNSMSRRLRISGILVMAGLVVEALCLMWSRPIAFVVLACVGGTLIGLGVLFFLYSLLSVAPHHTETSGLTQNRK
jgi:RsiW-degrading membrane proteinase PrsW (M82 family)